MCTTQILIYLFFSGKLLSCSFNFQNIEGAQLVLHTLTVFFRPMTFHTNLLCILDPSCRKMLKKALYLVLLWKTSSDTWLYLEHAVKNLPKLWQHYILPLATLTDIDLNFLRVSFQIMLSSSRSSIVYVVDGFLISN